jgi:hypothetical protein
MEVEVEGEVETECECPFCKKKFTTVVSYSDTVDIDPPDNDWRD